MEDEEERAEAAPLHRQNAISLGFIRHSFSCNYENQEQVNGTGANVIDGRMARKLEGARGGGQGCGGGEGETACAG